MCGSSFAFHICLEKFGLMFLIYFWNNKKALHQKNSPVELNLWRLEMKQCFRVMIRCVGDQECCFTDCGTVEFIGSVCYKKTDKVTFLPCVFLMSTGYVIKCVPNTQNVRSVNSWFILADNKPQSIKSLFKRTLHFRFSTYFCNTYTTKGTSVGSSPQTLTFNKIHFATFYHRVFLKSSCFWLHPAESA